MFTGLVEKIGRLVGTEARGAGARMAIECGPWQEPLRHGESVAIQGVCLTVTEAHGGCFACDVLTETLRRSTLGRYKPGARVNLERALRAGDRLGGHLVTGHVDGVTELLRRDSLGDDWQLAIACSDEFRPGIVKKGSIACDGVSLTVAEVQRDFFTVYVIPHTWMHTTLNDLRPGDLMNVELDLLGKYARSQATETSLPHRVTPELLARAGFLELSAPEE